MSAPDPFAFGGFDDSDAEIRSLFREWCAAHRALHPSEKFTDEEFDEAVHVSNRIAERIYDAPVQGVIGIAIKVFMAAQVGHLGGRWVEPGNDPCALGPFLESHYGCRRVRGTEDTWTDVAHLFLGSHALRGLLASAAQFAPELQPLVAKATGSPITLPLND